MNAIEMLHDDHRHIKQLLKHLEDVAMTDPAAREGLLDRLNFDLALHSRLEEDVFYPAFEQAAAGQHEAARFEALEEHRLIDKALADLGVERDNTAQFAGRVKVLKELVEHHVREEEREMFPLAKTLMTPAELNEVGHRMSVRRAELFAGLTEAAEANPRETIAGVGAILGSMENTALDAVATLMAQPAKSIGRGVEEVVRGGAHLAGEILGGVRKGLTEGRRETQANDERR